jgi:pimeloyl-[acyl-carrier protein] methyl ester esterase
MKMFSEQSGHGLDVVLIHGWGSHGGVWTEIARELAQDFRVTVPDLPGHGRSRDFASEAFTPEAMAEQIRQRLSGPAIWVGWSMGGLVALAAAQQLARAVSGLVLVNATPKYVQSPDWPHAMPPAVLDQFAQNLEQDYAGTIERFLTLQTAGDNRAVLRRLRETFRHGEPVTAALRAGLRLLMDQDRRAVLPGIATPALVIQGERDRLVPMGAARFLAEHLPRARLAPVPGAGHAPFLSHPAAFLETLKSFIQYDKTSEAGLP